MYAFARFFWPITLLVMFTAFLVREIGTGVVMALVETELRWKAMKRHWHPSTRR